jgi:hypothetical protein
MIAACERITASRHVREVVVGLVSMETGLARNRWCRQHWWGQTVRESILLRKAILAAVLLPSLMPMLLLALRMLSLPGFDSADSDAALLFPRLCFAHRRNRHVEGKLAPEYVPLDLSQPVDSAALPAPESSCSGPWSQRRHRVCTLHHRSLALAWPHRSRSPAPPSTPPPVFKGRAASGRKVKAARVMGAVDGCVSTSGT